MIYHTTFEVINLLMHSHIVVIQLMNTSPIMKLYVLSNNSSFGAIPKRQIVESGRNTMRNGPFTLSIYHTRCTPLLPFCTRSRECEIAPVDIVHNNFILPQRLNSHQGECLHQKLASEMLKENSRGKYVENVYPGTYSTC